MALEVVAVVASVVLHPVPVHTVVATAVVVTAGDVSLLPVILSFFVSVSVVVRLTFTVLV